MANPIQLKRSTTAGNVPSSLAQGELAVNIPDRLAFVADGGGTIRNFNLTSDAEKVASGPIFSALGGKLGTTGDATNTLVTVATAARPLKNRLADTLNVGDYGTVDPTGAADSSAAFQAAYNAAATGARIIVPPGNYKLTTPPTGSKYVIWDVRGSSTGGAAMALPGLMHTGLSGTDLAIQSTTSAADLASRSVRRTTSHAGGFVTLTLTNVSGTYVAGDQVGQTNGARGTISSYNSTANTLVVNRTSATQFAGTTGTPGPLTVTSATNGSTGTSSVTNVALYNTVSSGFLVNHTVGNLCTNFEWGMTVVMDNQAATGENVAIYGQGNKRGAGPTWAGVFEACDYTGQSDPTGALLGLEVDIEGNGTDANLTRIGIDMVLRRPSGSTGAAAHAYAGLRFQDSGDPSIYDNLITTTGNLRFTNGLNLSGATIQSGGSAIKLAVGQPIAFDVAAGNTLAYVPAFGAMLFSTTGGLGLATAALGQTTGNSQRLLQLYATDTNTDNLIISLQRLASGSDWTSAAMRLQRVVDGTGVGSSLDFRQAGCVFSGPVGFNNAAPSRPSISGSRGGNAALASLLTGLANIGLITDSTSA